MALAGLALWTALVAPRRSDAVELDGDVGRCRFTVLAPDSIRQGETLNVLLVLRARGDSPVELVAEVPPRAAGAETAAGAGAFVATGPRSWRREVVVPPDETVRTSLRGWRATHVVPPGFHADALTIRLSTADQERTVTVPCRTVRGATVARGWWSILAPALLSLIALPAFYVLLRRHARHGAWRTSVPARIPPAADPWWREP